MFIDPLKGVLALFLLELGLVASARLGDVKRFGAMILVVGLGAPPLLAVAGALVGQMLGLSVGGITILATRRPALVILPRQRPCALRFRKPTPRYRLQRYSASPFRLTS